MVPDIGGRLDRSRFVDSPTQDFQQRVRKWVRLDVGGEPERDGGHAPYVLALVLGALLLRISTLFVSILNSDEAYLAMQGHVLARGGQLYRDIADRKPPLVPLIYAAVFRAVGRDSLIAVHLLAGIVSAATAYIVGRIARRWLGGSAERLAACVYLLSSVAFLPAEALAANFETFMTLPLCAAIFVAGSTYEGKDALAGALLGLAVLCKQTAAVAIVPAVYLVAVDGTMTALVCFAVGFTMPLGIAAWALGPSELFFWTVSNARCYLSFGSALAACCWRGLWMSSAFLAMHGPLTWLVWRTRGTVRSPALRVLWLWFVVSVIAVCSGLRFFGHYYEQLLAPAALLATVALQRLSARSATRTIAAMAVLAVFGAGGGFLGRSLHHMPEYDGVAAYVRNHSNEGQRVEVWGHFPELYWAAERAPASRLVHDGFLTGASGGRPRNALVPDSADTRFLWAQYLCDLRAHPPQLFIDTSTAALRDYDQYPLSRFPELAHWLEAQYVRAAVVDRYVIYVRTATMPALATRSCPDVR